MSLSNYRRALAGYGTSSPDPRGNWARTCSTSGLGDTYFPDIAEHGELSACIEVKWKKSHTRSSPRDHETPHSHLRTRRSAQPQTISSLDRHTKWLLMKGQFRKSSARTSSGSMTECPENAIRYDVRGRAYITRAAGAAPCSSAELRQVLTADQIWQNAWWLYYRADLHNGNERSAAGYAASPPCHSTTLLGMFVWSDGNVNR